MRGGHRLLVRHHTSRSEHASLLFLSNHFFDLTKNSVLFYYSAKKLPTLVRFYVISTITLRIFTRGQNAPTLKQTRPPLPNRTRVDRHGAPWDFPPQRRRAATRAPPSELLPLLRNSTNAIARFFDLLYRSPVADHVRRFDQRAMCVGGLPPANPPRRNKISLANGLALKRRQS